MKESKRLLKNTGIIAIGNMSTKLISFLLLPLYTSFFTPSEYGIHDYINIITAFCVPFITLLLDEGMFRFLIDCKNDQEKKKVISISSIVIVVEIILFLFITIPILILLKYQYSVYLLLYIISSVFTTMMNSILRGLGKYDKFAVYNFLTSVTAICLNILFIGFFRMGIHGILSAGIISHFLITIIFFINVKIWKYIDFRIYDKKNTVKMIKYSVPLIPDKLAWTTINGLSRVLIITIIGSTASGLYAVSYKFPNFMNTIYGFFYQSWKESSARALNAENVEDFYNMIYEYLKSFMYSIVIGMTAFMPLAFFLLIDDKFSQAILYVPILLLGMYFSNIFGFYGGIFTAYKDTKTVGKITIIALVVNIAVIFLLIWDLGLYAAAFSTLISNFVLCIYSRIKVRQYVKLKENNKSMLFSIITTIVVWVLFYSQKMLLQCIGCIVAVIYVLITNRKLLFLIFRKIRNR